MMRLNRSVCEPMVKAQADSFVAAQDTRFLFEVFSFCLGIAFALAYFAPFSRRESLVLFSPAGGPQATWLIAVVMMKGCPRS